jgi:hypothetical protein
MGIVWVLVICRSISLLISPETLSPRARSIMTLVRTEGIEPPNPAVKTAIDVFRLARHGVALADQVK